MNTVTRGIRNAFRNTIRTFSIVVILGLSVGLALSMLVARDAVQHKIESVKSSIGNTITISPAGVQGFEGGGQDLTTDQLAKISKITNVTQLTEILSDRLTGSDTNLVSAIDAGTFGNRQANNSGVGFQGPPPSSTRSGSTSQPITRTFTPPVLITGTNNVSSSAVFGGSSNVNYTSGVAINPTADINEAIMGKALATKNNLNVGGTFTVYGQMVKLVGIYDTGTTFSNAGLVISLPAMQRLSSQLGSVSNSIVTVNSVDNVNAVVASAKSALGTAADVTNNQSTAQTVVAPLENVKSISMYSLIGSLGAGSIIILLTMMMIVRERRREIGVMKAIGASNIKTMFQFIVEAVTLTLLGMVIGIIIGISAASPITKVLINNSASNASQTSGPGGGRGLRAFGNNGIASVRNVQTSVGWNILGYGFGAAMIISIIGSALPALLISKVRPADVMRAE